MSNLNKRLQFQKQNKSFKFDNNTNDNQNDEYQNYPDFKRYFPDNDDHFEDIADHLTVCQEFINKYQSTFAFTRIIEDKCFNIDYRTLIDDDNISKKWMNFNENLITNTDYILKCMGLAMFKKIYNSENDEKKTTIRAKLINFEPILNLKDLRVNYFGKLVSIRGTIIKTAHIKIQCQFLTFICQKCMAYQICKQIDNTFTQPITCPTKGCKSKSHFTPDYRSIHTKTIEYQNIKIQELNNDEKDESSRIPRMLECKLQEDLVNSCMPGDDITITGVMRVNSGKNLGKNQQNTLFDMYLDAVSITNNRGVDKHRISGIADYGSFDTDDCIAIREIHTKSNLFSRLVNALCPDIYGHEMVKAGLLLALFGGTKSPGRRSESHVLIIGDPGLGKSQMLQACVNVASRGVYVCSNTSTGSGLTVTLARENGGEFALEAGALMLADQGCCCIDEFDKVPSKHACLLEAMEQQSISIAKGGVLSTLPTRTTILAAANPSGGHYNRSRTIAENLKISSPMLSRFDLIFVLLDKSQEDHDKLLTKHVLSLHSKLHKEIDTKSHDHPSHELLRKYLVYAQKYVNPQLSDPAKLAIKNFYINLRKRFKIKDSTPITTRQLHSLIRLTQARAKIELREIATEQDAFDVIEIMRFSLDNIFTDDKGFVQIDRSQNSTGMSTRKQAMNLLQNLQNRADTERKSHFHIGEIKQICQQSNYRQLVESLNIQGFLLHKGNGNYQLITADSS